MQFLTEWIMQIITFIFIGSIAQMMIPSNAYKKYIQLIVGLLLLFILTKPLILLLQMDFTKELEDINNSLFEEMDQSVSLDEDLLLEAERGAYIWNEVKNVMMQEANEQLLAEDTEVMDMSFHLNDQTNDLEKIEVQLMEKSDQENDYVPSVQINIEETTARPIASNDARLKDKLADIWQVDQSLLEIAW